MCFDESDCKRNYMKYKYDLDWLINEFDEGNSIKLINFWGHSNNSNKDVGKFCFSQWFESPFHVDGITYPTAEHWMMANKALLFNDLVAYKQILTAKSPGEAKNLGRNVMGFDEMLWVNKRYEIVVMGNIHKFNQHSAMQNFLMNTRSRVLVEASPIDKIWGIGLSEDAEGIDNPYFWNGLNLLGFALMEVRDFFAEFGTFHYTSPTEPLPWKIYPEIDSQDIFWRMGKGEDIISKVINLYNSLNEKEKLIFQLSNPAPYHWSDFY